MVAYLILLRSDACIISYYCVSFYMGHKQQTSYPDGRGIEIF